jgi:hypothetical protein
MSTEALMRRVAVIAALQGASRGPSYTLWLPDDLAKYNALLASGVRESEIMTVKWLDPSTPEPHEDYENA